MISYAVEGKSMCFKSPVLVLASSIMAFFPGTQILFASSPQMEPSQMIEQCTSYLPLNKLPHDNNVGKFTGLRHTWLKIDDRTYGMPFTITGTYFGGPATINTPDPFVAQERVKGVICTPVFKPVTLTDADFMEQVECVARKLSVGPVLRGGEEVFLLDYHVFKNNCLAAVNFMVSCGGGVSTQRPNAGIGEKFDPDLLASLAVKTEARHERRIIKKIDEVLLALGKPYNKKLLSRTPNWTLVDAFLAQLQHVVQTDELIQQMRKIQILQERRNAARLSRELVDLRQTVNYRNLHVIEQRTYGQICQGLKMSCGVR